MSRLVVELPPDAVKAGAAEIRKALAAIGAEGRVLDREMVKNERSLKSQERAYNRLAAELDPVIRKNQQLERAQRTLDNALKAGITTLAEHDRLLKLASSDAGILEGALARIGPAVISAFSVGAVVGFVGQMAEVEKKLQSIEGRLLVATEGNLRAAHAEMDFVHALAQRLGLDYELLVTGYSKLTVATRGTNLEGRQTKEIFNSVAEAAASLGLNGSDLEGVLLAITQMISKGTVSAEELRGQLGERLPGAFKIAADSIGVTTGELGKLLQTGKLATDDFLPGFAAGMHEAFGPQAEDNAARLGGAMNRLNNDILALKKSTLDAGLGDVLASGAAVAAAAVESLGRKTQRIYEEFDVFMKAHPYLAKFLALGTESGLSMLPGGSSLADQIARSATRPEKSTDQAKSMESYFKRLAGEDKQVAEIEAQITALTKELADARAKAREKATAAAEREREALDRLRGEYDPWGAAVRKLEEDQDNLTKAFAAGKIGRAEMQRQLDELEKSWKALTEGTAPKEIPIDIDTSRYDASLQKMEDDGIAAAAVMSDAMVDALSAEKGFADQRAAMKKLEEEWGDFQQRAADNLLENMQRTIAEIARDLAKTGNPLLDSMISVFADLLAEWAVLQVKMLGLSLKRIAAEKAAQSAANSASGSGSSIFSNGFESGDMSSWSKVGTSSYWSQFAGTGGSSYSAAGGYGSTAMVAGAWLAGMLALAHLNGTSGRAEAEGTLGIGALGPESKYVRDNGAQASGAPAASLVQALNEATALAAKLLDDLDVSYSQMSKLGEEAKVQLRREGRGKNTKWAVELADGTIKGFGRDMQAALEYAAIESIRQADLNGLDPNVSSAIKNSVATTFDAFESDVEFAMNYVNSSLDEVAKKMRTSIESGIEAIQKAVSLGMDPQLGLDMLTRDLSAQRNAILGIQESPEEKLRREAAAWEAERQLEIARLELDDAKLAVEEANLRAELGLADGEAELTKYRLDLRGRALVAEGGMLDAEAQMLGAAFAQLAAITKARETIQGVLSGLGNLGISDADIAGALKRISGGGGNYSNRQRDKMISELEAIRQLQAKMVTSELNPGGMRARLDAARAEYEKLAKQAAESGYKKVPAGLASAAELYYQLYTKAYGTTGGGSADLWASINDLLSKELTKHGIAPVSAMPSLEQQHKDQASAFARTFKKSAGGNLLTFDPDAQKKLASQEALQVQLRTRADTTNYLLDKLVKAATTTTTYVAPTAPQSQTVARAS